MRIRAVYRLPICGLPRKHERGSQNGVRVFSRERADSFLQSLEGNTAVFVSHAAHVGAVCQESDVLCREREQSMHDVVMSSTNLEDTVLQLAQRILGFWEGNGTYVGIWRVQRVNPLASMALISLQMAATWKINLRSSTERN